VHSEELLDKPEIVPSLAEATARASWVVGTSSRHVAGVPVFTPRELGRELARRASEGQQVALVFGDERSGLSNEEVTACHALSRIPVAPEQPSLNLAQSVALYAYEARLACEETREASPRPTATDEELRALVDRASAALTAVKFLDPENPRHALSDLLHTFQRAQLSPREYRLWSAVFGALAKAQPRSPRIK
jgi:TrmH family RNA methyltransferase